MKDICIPDIIQISIHFHHVIHHFLSSKYFSFGTGGTDDFTLSPMNREADFVLSSGVT
ncbi:MAG: hypothetical protein IPP01_05905 [Saprospiraceae bacterium]|nr:hypothetical protein [Saprospiraceae bacterium]